MNEVLATKIQSVEHLLEKYDYDSALAVLKTLAHEYPNEGVIPYYLGRMCLIGKDEKLAQKYIFLAIKMGYETSELYLTLALLQKNTSTIEEAEESFLKAIKLADSTELSWAGLSCLAVLYIENEMYLKADKIVKKIVSQYPDSYQGYHLHITIDAMREKYDDVFAYMDMLPEKFKTHPQYLIDVIEIYKKSGKEKELSDAFENDLRFNSIIPQIVLKEKISAIPNEDGTIEEKELLIKQLANEFHDKDAILSVMILEFSKKNFEKSSKIANIVLENERGEAGLRYYLALYFQIYNLYYLSEKKPSVALRNWIQDSGNWCIRFVEGLKIPAVEDMVRSSIQELFDEINRNAQQK